VEMVELLQRNTSDYLIFVLPRILSVDGKAESQLYTTITIY